MPRLRRFLEAGLIYHVTQRGNNRCAIVRTPSDYEAFHLCLCHVVRCHAVRLHAWAMMTTHMHLMLTLESPDALPRMMQDLGRRYVPYFNQQHHRTGTLFEGRYRAFVVDSDRYFLECMRYVDLNPVRGHLVSRPADYAWCSYRANALGAFDPLITPHDLYVALGRGAPERQSGYRRLCAQVISEEEHQRIRLAVNSRPVNGRLTLKAQSP